MTHSVNKPLKGQLSDFFSVNKPLQDWLSDSFSVNKPLQGQFSDSQYEQAIIGLVK